MNSKKASAVNCQKSKVNGRQGLMALPSIMVIAVLVFVAGIGLAGSGFFENMMGFADADAKRALFAAEAGVEDAFNRVVKNKKCNSGGTPPCSNYSLPAGEGTAQISVSDTGGSQKTILSTGTVRGKQKKIRAVVNFDANNKATLESWEEIVD